MELEQTHLPESEHAKEAAAQFNAAANKLVHVIASIARTSGENELSIAEKNVDFALTRVAHALKGGSDVAELLKQLEQTTIVEGRHFPDADIVFDEVQQAAHDYLKTMRG